MSPPLAVSLSPLAVGASEIRGLPTTSRTPTSSDAVFTEGPGPSGYLLALPPALDNGGIPVDK